MKSISNAVYTEGADGAFKKLESEPGSNSSGSSNQNLGSSSATGGPGHNPSTNLCPTPARRRHRTAFTQVFSFLTLFGNKLSGSLFYVPTVRESGNLGKELSQK